MASDLEEQKKLVVPFMQRAQEIQQADPKVAYYCRMYAVDQALKLPHRAKEITGLLTATLNQLERDKAQLKLDPAADRIHCLGFALRIFDNADRVDRAGRATERTSVAFYAASVFIEILNQFEGGVDAELLEKQRYCAWRAAEIRKALREGRQPTPPPAAATAGPAGDGSAAASGALADLPPASGSSDWAYAGQGGQSAPPPPPLPQQSDGSFAGVSGPSFGAASAYSAGDMRPGGDSFAHGGQSVLPLPPLHERAPPPSMASSFARGPERVEPPAAGPASGSRLWPGARVLVHTEEGLEDGAEGGGQQQQQPGTKLGTVGQVIRRPDGGFSYKVALPDRLLEIPDEAAVPALQEGGTAWLVAPPPGVVPQQQQPSIVNVVLINDASWPPSYLIQTADGKEHAVTAQQLAPPPPGGISTPAMTAASPAATPPHHPPAAPASPPRAPSPPPVLHPPPPAPPAPPSHPAYGATAPSAPAPFPSLYGGHAAPPTPAGPQAYPHSYSGPALSAAGAGAQRYGYGNGAPTPPAAHIPSLPPGYKPPVALIMDAQKQAKYAVSALSFEDIHTAVKHLSEALRLLTSPQQ
ncbi:hypothetical protein PLESTF_000371800 [Pleodorina starrii]|nr:hypothetical protein PLESTF_000371800 [Pleodorina starrii]